MNKLNKSFSLALLIVVFLFSVNGFFVVNEGQKALVLTLGDLKTSSTDVARVYEPGLHIKWPLISTVKKLDTRVLGFDSGVFSVLTSKQTALELSYYVKWRILDPALFYKRTGASVLKAESLMEPKINDIVRASVGNKSSDEVISTKREVIMTTVLDQARKAIEADYGIQIIDVRLQTVKLPERVLTSVFNRMASERKQFANNKRAEGLRVAERVKANADQQVVIIEAEANQQAALIKAQGDEEAAKIYADAYNKDQKFYGFYRRLEAYRDAFPADNQDMLVLSPSSDFFKYFNREEQKS